MAALLRVFLIISGLAGICSITTVSEVSVQKGKSISIPCLYNNEYSKNVKYLCKGYWWNSCSYAVRTKQDNSRNKKFSIFDDDRGIFNVTINDLTEQDTDYWCAVEINYAADVKQHFQLSVTTDKPRLYVENQEIKGFQGENSTIKCNYHNTGGTEGKWCKIGRFECVTTYGSGSGLIDGTTVTIDKSVGAFTVTMHDLEKKNSGWYWCLKGDLTMPVHITVSNSTATVTTTSPLTTISPTSEPVNLTTVFTDGPNTTNPDQQQGVRVDLKNFIIPLSVLVFIVILSVFIWFMLKRRKQTKAAASAMNGVEMDVTYATVKKKGKTSNQRAQPETDQDVTYSSVVPTRPQRVQRQVEANDDKVTYSVLT